MAKRNTGPTARKTTTTKPKATKTPAKATAKKPTAAAGAKKAAAPKTTTAKKTTTRKSAPVKKAAASKTVRKVAVKKIAPRRRKAPAIPPAPAFELFEGTGKFNHFFHLTNSEGKVLVMSQAFGTEEGRQENMSLFRKVGSNKSRYNRFSSSTGQHFFRITGENGSILGSSQMYENKEARDAAIEEIMNILPKASMKRKK